MAMSLSVRIHAYGGTDQMRLEPVEVPDPPAGEIRVRHTAIGVNFIDIYERTGLYQMPLPTGLGREAAGVVDAVGRGVRGLRPGDRVAYVYGQPGAYSELRNVPAERLVRLPARISDETAAAIMLKGLTAQALVRQTFPLRKAHTVLIHAAAGGVGSLLVQWARHLGAHVIGVVGSEDKAQRVRALGVEHVLLDRDAWAEQVRAHTGGEGVHVVYDSVGRDTFARSLSCLRPRGMMVSYGNASGAVEPLAPLELARHGSLYLTRPVLFHYIATRRALVRAASELFDLVGRSVLDVHIGQRYALADVARAHQDLEGRRTVGSTILLP